MNIQDYYAERIQDKQKFLLKLLHLHIGNYYPLRKWLGISFRGKIDEVSHLSIGYNTKYFKKGKKWYKQQTREYQQPDLGYKLNLVLDRIPQLVLLPALLQPAFRLASVLLFSLTTTTYQPSTKDTYISSANPNKNYSAQSQLNICDDGESSEYRTILHFDISDIPDGATFSQGDISLYCWKCLGTGNTSYANRMTRLNWTEAGATWNKYDGTNAWTTAGGDYTTTNRASLSISSTGWKTWSSYTLIQNCYDNQSKNIHLLFNATVDDIKLYRSRRYTDDTSLRPKLTVTYTVPVTSYSTTAVLSRLEATAKTTSALLSQLEKVLQSTTSLASQLEGKKVDLVALLTELQHQGYSTTAIQTLLERIQQGDVALISELQRVIQDTLALKSTLRAKIWRREYYTPSQNWIKEDLHN